ncbi:MAG TPA: hypothetical protein VIN10_07635 [Bacteroidales bacterium]
MKNVFKIMSAVVLTSLIFVGCNKVKSLADVTFDTTFKSDLNCVVPPASTREIDGTFSASSVIDPASDPDVAEYLDNITDYEILSMTGTITSVSVDNANLLSSTANVYNSSYNASWQFANVPLTVGTVLNFGNENGQWTTVDQILMTGQVFTVSLEGETDEDDITFTVQLAIETQITANPL